MERNDAWDPQELMDLPDGAENTYEALPLYSTRWEVEFLRDLPGRDSVALTVVGFPHLATSKALSGPRTTPPSCDSDRRDPLNEARQGWLSHEPYSRNSLIRSRYRKKQTQCSEGFDASAHRSHHKYRHNAYQLKESISWRQVGPDG